jgi:hypothetical protein
MKKLLLLFLSSLMYAHSSAQNNKVNEIGLGIGYIEWNPYSEYYISGLTWTHNTVFKSDVYRNVFFDRNNTQPAKSYATPIIYYSNTVSKHSSIRYSYQYAYQKGSVSGHFWNQYNEPATYQYELKQHNLTVGYAYSFLIRKHAQFSLCSDFELIYSKRSGSEIGGVWLDWETYYSWIDANSMITTNSMQFYLHQGLGLKIPLTKSFNIRYECSAKFVDEYLMIRPLNRFSINYLF